MESKSINNSINNSNTLLFFHRLHETCQKILADLKDTFTLKCESLK